MKVAEPVEDIDKKHKSVSVYSDTSELLISLNC